MNNLMVHSIYHFLLDKEKFQCPVGREVRLWIANPARGVRYLYRTPINKETNQ
jgi:hypothetical protein